MKRSTTSIARIIPKITQDAGCDTSGTSPPGLKLVCDSPPTPINDPKELRSMLAERRLSVKAG